MKNEKAQLQKTLSEASHIALSVDKLQALFLISQKINKISDINALLNEILNLAITNIEAERGLIILMDKSGEISRTVSSESLDEKEITFSRSIIKKTMRSKRILLSIDLKNDTQFKDSDSIIGLNILSFICVPLLASHYDNPLGFLYIDQRIHKKIFTNDDVAFLNAFANLATISIHNANLMERLKSEIVQLREEVGKKYSFPSVVGRGNVMQRLFHTMKQVMDDECTVLITGESGSGKEVIAKAIHFNGNRKGKPFVAINCGALPETLLEAELFGSTRGAFTGATDKQGLFQAAEAGTLFLDEIHHTSEAMQIKLLRALQEKEIRKVGGTRAIPVRVRLICASNENLDDAVKQGHFRQDFYYRINVVTIDVPPLREHKEDIPLLAEYFLQKYCKEKNKKCRGFDEQSINALITYDWSENNVRELENEIERIAIFLPDDSIVKFSDLSNKVKNCAVDISACEEMADEKSMTYDVFERKYIQSILSKAGGNKAKAARIMGIPRSTLMGKMRKLELF